MDQIDYDLTEFVNDIFVCEHQVTGQEGSSAHQGWIWAESWWSQS